MMTIIFSANANGEFLFFVTPKHPVQSIIIVIIQPSNVFHKVSQRQTAGLWLVAAAVDDCTQYIRQRKFNEKKSWNALRDCSLLSRKRGRETRMSVLYFNRSFSGWLSNSSAQFNKRVAFTTSQQFVLHNRCVCMYSMSNERAEWYVMGHTNRSDDRLHDVYVRVCVCRIPICRRCIYTYAIE